MIKRLFTWLDVVECVRFDGHNILCFCQCLADGVSREEIEELFAL
jgi:hypothetical protein